MAVDEVLDESGYGLTGTTTLSDIGPIEVMVLFSSSVPLLSFSTWQARCLIFVVPADLHVRVAGGRVAAPVQKAGSSVCVVGSFRNELRVFIIGEDVTLAGLAVEALVVPVSTILIEDTRRACARRAVSKLLKDSKWYD